MSNVLVGQTSSSYNIVKGESTLDPWERVTYIPGGVRLESNVTGAIAHIADRIFKIIYQKVGYKVTIQLLAFDTTAVVPPAPADIAVSQITVAVGAAAAIAFSLNQLGTKIVAQLRNDCLMYNADRSAVLPTSRYAQGGVAAVGGIDKYGFVSLVPNPAGPAFNAILITADGTDLPVASYEVTSATFIADNANIVV